MKTPSLDMAERIAQLPFLRLLLPLIAGIVFSGYSGLTTVTLIVTSVLVMIAILFFRQERLRRNMLWGLVFLLGITSARISTPLEQLPRNKRLIVVTDVTGNIETRGRWHRTLGEVLAYRPYDDSVAVWNVCRETIQFFIDTAYTVKPGERISTVVYINPLDTLEHTSGYAKTLVSRGITGRTFVIDGRLISRSKAENSGLLRKIRLRSQSVQRKITDRIVSSGMSPRETAVAVALLSGEKHLLDSEIRNVYSIAGISHVLAISGLHVGIIFLLLNSLFMPLVFLQKGRYIRSGVIVAVIWGFAFVSGMSASVLRSAFMFTVFQVSLMTMVTNHNSYNSLFSSAFVLLLIKPIFLYDLSFQLSYLSLFSILFFYPRMSRWTGVRRMDRRLFRRVRKSEGWKKRGWSLVHFSFSFIYGTLLLGFSAQPAVAPLVGYIFGRIPLLSLSLNPAVMVVLPVVMFSGLLFVFLEPLCGASWCRAVLEWSLTCQNRMADFTASLPFASLEGVEMSAKALSLAYVILFAGMFLVRYFGERAVERPKKKKPL